MCVFFGRKSRLFLYQKNRVSCFVLKNIDAINLLQLCYICKGELVNILDLPLEEEEVSYKEYGKDVNKEVSKVDQSVTKELKSTLPVSSEESNDSLKDINDAHEVVLKVKEES